MLAVISKILKKDQQLVNVLHTHTHTHYNYMIDFRSNMVRGAVDLAVCTFQLMDLSVAVQLGVCRKDLGTCHVHTCNSVG